MELFDLLNVLFKDPNTYKEVSKLDKKKNFFMIQRRLAIGHPIQASLLNSLKINSAEAVDIWQRYLTKQYKGKVPYWMFTKGIKKVKQEQEKKVNISAKELLDFANINKFDFKSVKDAVKFYPDEIKKEINKYKNDT